MITRIRHKTNKIQSAFKNLKIKQVYARIYVKTLNKIIIVSKDGKKWQFPGGKPEGHETIKETLYREIYEETSINLKEVSVTGLNLFGFYYIKEENTEYLQVRFLIEIEDIEINRLRPNEHDTNDFIKYIKLIEVKKLTELIPRLNGGGEIKSFLGCLKKNHIFNKIINERYGKFVINWKENKNKRYINIESINKNLKNFFKKQDLQKLENKELVNIDIIGFLRSGKTIKNYQNIIDEILINIMGISFFKFNHCVEYQKYIISVIDNRIIKTKNKNIVEYKNYAINNGQEKNTIIGYISPSTSYFFRDNLYSELGTISKYLTNNHINILFLGCSTGSEVYSSSFYFKENKIEYNILATDINIYSLNYAKKGTYNESLINNIDKSISNRLFKGNSINKKYKENIEFKQLNILLSNEYPKNNFDIIFVRNTIKYFSEENKKTIFNNIKQKIKKGGIIIMGIQEGSNRDTDPKDYLNCTKIGEYSFLINNPDRLKAEALI